MGLIEHFYYHHLVSCSPIPQSPIYFDIERENDSKFVHIKVRLCEWDVFFRIKMKLYPLNIQIVATSLTLRTLLYEHWTRVFSSLSFSRMMVVEC